MQEHNRSASAAPGAAARPPSAPPLSAPRSVAPFPSEPGVQRLRGVNWSGLYTLYLKEVRRFYKVQLQTVWAPAVTSLLFLAIFTLALGGARGAGRGELLGVPYPTFLAPGLVIMGIAQNAFANSSSSLLIAKVQGTIIDLLMPPLSAGEMLTAFVAGAVTRAWAVGIIMWGALLFWPGVDVSVRDPLALVFFGTAGAMLLALMGVLTGLWAEKFDHSAFVTNFIVQPLTLLSGTFYLIGQLPPTAETVSRLNPFFYMIDGFRAGFIGASEAAPLVGGAVVGGLVAVLWGIALLLLRSGWKLRD